MKTLYLFIALSMILDSAITNAQQQQFIPDNKYESIVKPGSKLGWIEFKKGTTYKGDNIFNQAPDLLNMSGDDALSIFKTNTDLAGNKHYKYAQYYKGIRVEGVEQYAHERNGELHLINGDFVEGLNMDINPLITPEQSVKTTLAAFPAKKYMWQDSIAEANFKLKKNDPDATLYPTPELLIVKRNAREESIANNYTLAYRMYVFAKIPQIAKYVYIDAVTGELIRTRELEYNCNSTSYETTYNGTRTVYTDFRTEECDISGDDVTKYFSINDCNAGTEIRSYYSASYDAFDYGEDYLKCSDDNIWYTSGSTKMVMTSLWAVAQAFKYFDVTYGHESFDGSSGLIDIFNNKTYFTDDDDEPYCGNANYTNIIDNLSFGAGSDCETGTLDDYNPLDIVGHEYTHGIVEYAHFDALDYSEESGALNESFADIFGEMVEHYIEGGEMTWLHGEDMTTGPNRSFINPNDVNDPDTYFGSYWASLDGDDNGGVHTNSSVQNHMFYLLSEGGSGTNDNGIEYYVDGIGWNAARSIAWQAMMEYLDGSDGYIIARNAWIQSAIDLYGSCSQEVISVGQAWQAVGVTEFTAFDRASICGSFVSIGYADATYGIENSTLVFDDFLLDCTTTIYTTASVTFESGYYIQLNPGFTALSGATLTAWIDPCEVSDYDPDEVRLADTENYSEEEFSPSINTRFNLYPSPADNYITIDLYLENPTDVVISIFDIAGNKVSEKLYQSTIINGNSSIASDTKQLSNGMYIAVVQMDGISWQEKFIVQH
ncbi:MAG: M4 family metallopeptidase [Chitinophagales bacterium]|nr:M4 family metallopeptidase [Bacteroidota bacterium]MBP7399549.1 M4 family metallopeptidase [Chitinophagales bacterium]MBP8754484.1 M4 family metallopeptidase [Chitinophagales bacterium]MBP9190094.1 M4 family metallopeptidase [Chitinophagales bacterium]MBP9549276.1 M4 family metallopeptidase [Chitinophagales bacterium]